MYVCQARVVDNFEKNKLISDLASAQAMMATAEKTARFFAKSTCAMNGIGFAD